MVKELLREAMKKGHQVEKELHSRGIQEWQNMYATAENRLNKLFELYCDGEIKKDEYAQRKTALMNDKQKARQYLDDHGEAQKSWLDYSEKLIITTNHVYEIFKNGTVEEIKMMMQAIGNNYVLKDGYVSFQFREPFNYIMAINESKSSNKSGAVRW
jgi:hypothetical protein